VRSICTVYKEAPQLAQEGEQTVSTDELTAIQALERKHPGLPLAPGKVERREFEYIRHGTRCLIVSRDVVTGKILAPACGPTRTEADFLAHLQALAYRLRQSQHPSIRIAGALGRPTVGDRRGPGHQRGKWYSGLHGQSSSVPECPDPQRRLPLYAQAQFVDESN
jgi:hypothetical protein